MLDALKYFAFYLIINIIASIVVLISGIVVYAIMGQPLVGMEEMLYQPWIISTSTLLTN